MLSGKYECFGCGEVFEDFDALRHHEREDHERKDPELEGETRENRVRERRTRGAP